MTRARKVIHEERPLPVLAFVPLDCSKPAFRHLRVRGSGYESMLPINQAIPPKKYVEMPKKRRGRK